MLGQVIGLVKRNDPERTGGSGFSAGDGGEGQGGGRPSSPISQKPRRSCSCSGSHGPVIKGQAGLAGVNFNEYSADPKPEARLTSAWCWSAPT